MVGETGRGRAGLFWLFLFCLVFQQGFFSRSQNFFFFNYPAEKTFACLLHRSSFRSWRGHRAGPVCTWVGSADSGEEGPHPGLQWPGSSGLLGQGAAWDRPASVIHRWSASAGPFSGIALRAAGTQTVQWGGGCLPGARRPAGRCVRLEQKRVGMETDKLLLFFSVINSPRICSELCHRCWCPAAGWGRPRDLYALVCVAASRIPGFPGNRRGVLEHQRLNHIHFLHCSEMLEEMLSLP